MNLPELDYTSDEALQASAETRANVAMIAADGPLYFKGMALRLTISIKSLFFMLRKMDGATENDEFRDERDTILLLYLATQDPAAWSDPVKQGAYFLQPLRSRPGDWLAAIDAWADALVQPAEMQDAVEVIHTLWTMHHATRTAPDDAGTPAATEKKTVKSPGKSESPQPSGQSSEAPSSKSARKRP